MDVPQKQKARFSSQLNGLCTLALAGFLTRPQAENSNRRLMECYS
jgi:hypothetical protein